MVSIRTEESVADLMAIYEPVIRRCCRRFRLPEDRVEDMTHDVFLAAYRNLPNYRGENQMSAWLWSIARHEIVDQIRKEATRRRTYPALSHLSSSMETLGPADSAQKSELSRALKEAVDTLPTSWRQVVTLHYWKHHNAKEIARRMGIKPTLVCVILHRSRKRLRENLRSTPLRSGRLCAVLGPWLAVDSEKERFTRAEAGRANRLLPRDYREPYVVPEKV